MELALWAAIGYLFGSFPTGYLAVKIIRGEDIRTFGSGNTGGTNVGRVMGKKWAVLVTLADMLKGGAVVMLCRAFGGSDAAVAAAAFAAVCGHNYPVWLGFHGGKGVATTLGTLFFVQMWPSCAAVLLGGVLWFLIMKATRYVSVASLAALLFIAGSFYFFGLHRAFVILALVLAALSLWRHRANLKRLAGGTENKVGQK
ncbi:glycerol-3-phosphate 1-O-acyltransferase PlsY [Pyramidobacter sp.]|uniref:glycerol-3-phosphate 1-O-acyltransferase PlsY n=1 Tax=Pyramidobacter sp. TaxID=1943581 RepID=UPI0025ED88B5|nr:glycerol-3-phosphate 1-O-acyltransferase PlsY [Pyramidobacter sp.]MCI7403648.1 glycerol-3-phosphate 1-O-acyltransferase PlsY [Pyramidobacter sp.]MDY3212904.1 glycerol-3-phosphate 1-O-acyltransferase PlsY [Pyramidobacter sp.]